MKRHFCFELLYFSSVQKKQNKIVQNLESPKILEQKALERGLQTPISESCKGFQMLTRMGYQYVQQCDNTFNFLLISFLLWRKGMGLGKSRIGITEPISLRIKRGKIIILLLNGVSWI
jgi:hypothetical protein